MIIPARTHSRGVRALLIAAVVLATGFLPVLAQESVIESLDGVRQAAVSAYNERNWGAAAQAADSYVASLESAIELNGVAVGSNLAAFRWGRQYVIDPTIVAGAASTAAPGATPQVLVDPLPAKLARRLDTIGLDDADREELAMLTADLVGYQHAKYAGSFLAVVERVAGSERSLVPVVARSLHKLMAYKDEYEVARLLTGPDARATAEAVAGPGATITWRLHPPMLKALGLDDKLSVNEKVGRPMMLALMRGKRLRGTKLDPFGRTELRRTERALIDEYIVFVDEELAGLAHSGGDDLAAVGAALELPMDIRGYEDLKLQRVAEYREHVARRRANRG